ncbi:MAG: hypothetical protein ACYC97_13700 [Metallibacterium sp.]
MNTAAIALRGTWSSAERAQRWFSAAIFGALFVAAIIVMALLARANHVDGSVPPVLMMLGVFFWWMICGGRLLLVHRDLRTLRAPHAGTSVLATLAACVLITAILPAAALTVVGAPFGSTLALLCDAIAVALTWWLMPRYVAIFFGFVPGALNFAGNALGWPAPNEPAFALLGFEFAALGALVVLWRWRALLDVEPGTCKSWRTPMVFLMRGQQGLLSGALGGGHAASAQNGTPAGRVRIAYSSAALNPVAVMRHMLGGVYAPVGYSERLRRLAPVMGVFLLLEVLAVLFLPLRLFQIINQMIVTWTVYFGALLFPMFFVSRLTAVNRSTETMPLLALLPGMGAPALARRHLLMATARPMLMQLLLATGTLVAAWLAVGGDVRMIAVFVLVALGAGLVTVALMLHTLNSRALLGEGWRHATRLLAFSILAFALVLATNFGTDILTLQALHKSADMSFVRTHATVLAGALAASWALALLIATSRAHANWRAFQRRPHPFAQR